MFSYIERLFHPVKAFVKEAKSTKIHLLGWITFMLYESAIIGLFTQQFAKLGDYLIHYAINISLFYIHAHLILPKASRDKKYRYWRIPVYTIVELSGYILVMFITKVFLLKYTNLLDIDTIGFNQKFITGTIFRGLYFIGFSTGYYFLMTYLKENKRAEDLEKLRLTNIIKDQRIEQELEKAKNAYLKAQINPHFLFNTLDYIYHNTRKSSPLAAEAIATLSDMMRYATDTYYTGDYISLGDEIVQVQNLIDLYGLKTHSLLYIDLNYSEKTNSTPFIPLVLITLAENMFKHGNLTIESRPATINIYMEGNFLYIETDNLIKESHGTTGLNSGLANIAKRLEYSYGKASTFMYKIDERRHFKVFLSVEMTLQPAIQTL